MASPKHDYDSDKFYALVERAASVCFYDKDVATILDLDEDVFGSMKNGTYQQWTDEENKRRSELRILAILCPLVRCRELIISHSSAESLMPVVMNVRDLCPSLMTMRTDPLPSDKGRRVSK